MNKILKKVINDLMEYNHINQNTLPYNFNTFRALMNITMPNCLSEEYFHMQDFILREKLKNEDIVNLNSLNFENQIALFKGDITKIEADAIVNAGNPQLLGCFHPLHKCIDNCIHSYAGLQVRRDLINILNGRNVLNAEVVVTLGYNLPAKYIFHTVGPIYNEAKQNEIDLRNCYLNCLKKADEMNLESIVFCSLSTGIFGYPIDKASKIAVKTVKQYLNETKTKLKVLFDLFTEEDFNVYERTIKEIK